MQYIIKVENLKSYFDKKIILNNINLKIKPKEIVSIIGRSGSGKSTLLRCLNLLNRPDSGKIFFNNYNLLDSNISLTNLRIQIGMVFQHFNLFSEKTVLENCCLGLKCIFKMPYTEASQKAFKKLKEVGMEKFAYENVQKLSGGQKQRVAIARTLCMDPKIILLDEPTSALDSESAQEILKLLKNLVIKHNITLIIVTHELQFAKKVSNKIYLLENGQIIEKGNLNDIFQLNKCPKIKYFFEQDKK
ncbi:amino acid ABC transporter ATP-binding protein [Candidatus Phytoplasma gossypii]|uniref:ATP-binding cassette domain-containing protein n=1 Tax=Candidatus Phytoplasma gossypii TaxID=2982629 RepID=A0ABT9D0Z6_9MOLU|nr:ATP-binding cassette domain-containing protein ['Gossypium sp.' phytoplasma]MDO8057302.1 ATP-binding cassette domain-containing protein ['Gossypium sp.' phytoplasma]